MRIQNIILFFLLFCLSQNAMAQPACYESVRQNGLNLLKGKNPKYAEAINKFWAAYQCSDKPDNDDLDRQIKEAQTRWVAALEGLVAEAQAAEKLAVKSQIAEKSAREEAVRRREEAKEKGKRAESLRLSILSQSADNRDALDLAFMGILLGNEEDAPALEKAFFEAVRDSFSMPIFDTEAYNLASTNNGGVLAKNEKEAFFFLKNNPSQPIQISRTDNENLFFKTNSKTGDLAIWSNNSLSVFDEKGNLKTSHTKHSESILDASFSASGEKIITASRDNSVVVTDLKTGASAKIEAHDGNIYEAEFSPNEQFILTRSSDGKIRIWNTDGSMKSELKNTDGYFYTATFSPDSKQILTGSSDGIPKLWNLDGKLIQKNGLTFDAPIIEIAFLEGGKKGLAFAQNGRLGIWEVSGKSTFQNKESARIDGFEILENGNELLVWDNDFSIKKINASGDVLLEAVGHKTPIIHAEISSDGKFMLSTSEDGTTILWDAEGNIQTSWSYPADEVQPAFFDSKSRIITLPNSTGNEILTCPIPTLIVDDFLNKKGEHLKRAKALQENYKIQFLEEL